MNNSPNISINKLGEFVYASAAKKRSILKTIKFPSTFRNGRYPEPQSAFRNFMLDENHDKSVFEKKKNQINAKPADTDWAKSKRQCCLEAIDHLVYCSETLLIPYLKYIAEKKLVKNDFEANMLGVLVHFKPEVLLIDKKTKEVKGFIKMIFSKSRIIDNNEGSLIASIIKLQTERKFNKTLKEENCIVLDVFHRRKFNGQSLQKQKNEIQKACEEISSLWPTINN